MLKIEAKGLYYKALNRQIRESLSKGAKNIVLQNVLGQRYIGGGVSGSALFSIYGTPGRGVGGTPGVGGAPGIPGAPGIGAV